jgi:polysaccharide pyruvyl transferase WcaK-like protein
MDFVGKRTDVLELPKQLRSDPELGAAVRFLSTVNRRSIQMQILLWIVEGVEKEQSKFRQVASDGASSGAGPKSVRVRQRQEKSA